LKAVEAKEAATKVMVVALEVGGREKRKARRGDEEGEGRATIGKAIFALNVSMLRSKGYWLWRQQGRVTGIAGEHSSRGWRVEGSIMEELERKPLRNRKWDPDQIT
jgi:hypothetical protein